MAVKLSIVWTTAPGPFVILFRAFGKDDFYALSLWDLESKKNVILYHV